MANRTLFFDKSLQKLNVLFKYSGMNLKRKITTTSEMIKHRWLFTFNFLWVLSALIASFYYIYLGIIQGMDFLELTNLAPCTTLSMLAVFKSLFHFFCEKEVSDLIEIMRKLEIDDSQRQPSAEKDLIAAEDRKFLNQVINVLYFVNVSMLVVFDMIPIVLIAVKYYKTQEFEMLLPYLDVFIFLPYEYKYWPFAYIHQIWSEYVVLLEMGAADYYSSHAACILEFISDYFNTCKTETKPTPSPLSICNVVECVVLLEMGAADYLFFTCCVYIRIQFRLLQHDIELLIPENSEQMTSVEFQVKFNNIVRWHQTIIESSDILETIYSKSNLMNFLSSSLVICLTGFNVTIVDDIVVIVTFLTFLLMALTQVFFLCFFADLLMTASMDVSHAVYKCKWYMAGVTASKDLLLVQTRAQKPCRLTALGFADVNLNSFMRVLSSAWSYFALLQTIYGGSK